MLRANFLFDNTITVLRGPANSGRAVVNTNALDISGCTDASLVLITGTNTDLATTITLQHSDAASSGFEAVPSEEKIELGSNDIAVTDDNKVVYGAQYTGIKRYVRLSIAADADATAAANPYTVLGIMATNKRPVDNF